MLFDVCVCVLSNLLFYIIGCVIYLYQGQLYIEAQGDNTSEQVLSIMIDEKSHNLAPISIIQYAYQTETPIILNDAYQEGKFSYDPYLRQSKLKSVMCLPVINQQKVVGVLYLENNLMAGVFTSERLEVLKLICSQVRPKH